MDKGLRTSSSTLARPLPVPLSSQVVCKMCFIPFSFLYLRQKQPQFKGEHDKTQTGKGHL